MFTRRIMKKQTKKSPRDHYCVYVVKLEGVPRGRGREVYVGMTGLTPEARFDKHRTGYKSSRWVHKYGTRLLPELYSGLSGLSYREALLTEKSLARTLRDQGYKVYGGH